jgi:hypothetical protein
VKRLVPYAAVLIFAVFLYLEYKSAIRVVYLHRQSGWFGSLGQSDAAGLRKTAQIALAFSLSSLQIQDTSASLQQNVSSLQKIRVEAPRELWGILDLRLAKDHAMMARLEQANNPALAAGHRQSARALLRSLGWRQVSDVAVEELGDKQLSSRLKL